MATAILFSCIEGLKKILQKIMDETRAEKVLHFLPVISGILGAIFGLVAYFTMPDIMLGNNIWLAIISGAASGLSATGCNQIFKQLKKLGVEVKEGQDGESNEV
jgi:hypothetical protein